MGSGCIACGGSDHSHRTCVLVGAALHRWMLQLGPGKDMTLVVDIILRLLMWGWREARFGEKITCMSYTPGGDIISAGGSGGSVFFMSAQTGEKISCPVTGHTGSVLSVCFDHTGEKLASGGGYGDNTIRLWSTKSGASIGSPLTVDGSVDSVNFSPCGNKLAATCNNYANDFSVKIFSKAGSTGIFECQSTLTVDSIVESVVFSPDGTIIAAAHSNKIQLYDAQTQAKFGSPLNVESTVWSVAFSPDGDMIAAGCGDGKIHLVDVLTAQVKRSVSGHSYLVSCLAFKPNDPNILVSGSWDNTLKIWDLTTAACLSTVTVDSEVESAAAWHFPRTAPSSQLPTTTTSSSLMHKHKKNSGHP